MPKKVTKTGKVQNIINLDDPLDRAEIGRKGGEVYFIDFYEEDLYGDLGNLDLDRYLKEESDLNLSKHQSKNGKKKRK